MAVPRYQGTVLFEMVSYFPEGLEAFTCHHDCRSVLMAIAYIIINLPWPRGFIVEVLS